MGGLHMGWSSVAQHRLHFPNTCTAEGSFCISPSASQHSYVFFLDLAEKPAWRLGACREDSAQHRGCSLSHPMARLSTDPLAQSVRSKHVRPSLPPMKLPQGPLHTDRQPALPHS